MTHDIDFRPLARADFPMLHEWLARPHVAEWWQPTPALEELVAEYEPTLAPDSRDRAYIALADGAPIGFIQSYVVMGSPDGWWPDETDPGARGIDQFLADTHRLGQGLGTAMVRAFVARLFADPVVTRIHTDPSPDNARAIRCYEKAGFARVGIVDTPDGPALLMVQFRAKAEPRRR
ncbi:MAG TPA: GNAT family N-acetyltransferase [Gemmatimonadaceae bacterium]|nr:GNAT family N-acetyltransferase [Gemmatimonadaceae bacterium]